MHLLVFIVCSVANCLKYYLLTLFVRFFCVCFCILFYIYKYIYIQFSKKDSVFFRCPLFTSTFSLNYETANSISICCDLFRAFTLCVWQAVKLISLTAVPCPSGVSSFCRVGNILTSQVSRKTFPPSASKKGVAEH